MKQLSIAALLALLPSFAFAYDPAQDCSSGEFGEQLGAVEYYFAKALPARHLKRTQELMRQAYGFTDLKADGKWGKTTAGYMCSMLQLFRDNTGAEFEGLPTAQELEDWIAVSAANTVPGTAEEAAD